MTWSSTSFSTTVPLNSESYMPVTTVDGALTFSAGSVSAGGFCYLRLLANGSNAPVFSGFSESGISSGYNNTLNVDNQVSMWYDGVTSWYAVNQQVNAVANVLPAAVCATLATGTTIAVEFSASLYSSSTPSGSAFTVTASGGAVTVNSVSLSADIATLTLSRTIAGNETVSVAYAVPASSPLMDSTGTYTVRGFSSLTVGAVLQYATLYQASQSADSNFGYDYVGTVSGIYNGYGVTSTALPASSNGYICAELASLYNNGGYYDGPVLGLKTASSNGNYTTFTYGIYPDQTGSYSCVTSGTGGGTPDYAQAYTVGDMYRIRRSGSSVYGEVFPVNGSSWVTVKTWTSDAGAKLYGGVALMSSAQINRLTSTMNWA